MAAFALTMFSMSGSSNTISLFFPVSYAGKLGLETNPNMPVYSFPCVASYVGGDIVSGVLAARLHKKEELSIFIDIGTNGEIVLGNNEWLMSAACSAGPCFEGSGMKHGMRATEGAIENIKINRDTLDVEIKVIGKDTQPLGICGSGMIDAIAEMFLTGILNQKGKLQKEVSDRGMLRLWMCCPCIQIFLWAARGAFRV